MDPSVVGLIIGVILIVIVVLLIFWGRTSDLRRIRAARPNETVPTALQKPAVAAPEKPVVSSVSVLPEMPAAPAKADDLTIIEGVGPKIASLLKLQGFATFAQLAVADVPALEKILQENGLQFIKPASWPEQARLAAAGKMDELKALQDKLVAGR